MVEPGVRLRLRISPYVAMVISLLLTGVAWYFSDKNIETYHAGRFQTVSKGLQDEVSFRMQTYTNALVQTAGAYEIKGDFSRSEFKRYVEKLDFLLQYPGVQGIGFTKRLKERDLADHEKKIRAEGFPNYKVWPESKRSDYFSITSLEPFDWRNQRAFGYDMFSDPDRKAAMERAWYTGEPAATGKVRLVQETSTEDVQSGFLIYVPVFKKGAKLSTLEDRKAALVGFVYSPFRAKNLLEGILSKNRHWNLLGIEVFSGPGRSNVELLYQHDPEGKLKDPSFHPKYQTRTALQIAGQRWTLQIAALPHFEQGPSRLVSWAILAGGILVSLLLFWIIRSYWKGVEAERIRSVDLEKLSQIDRERASQLEILHQIGKLLAGELDLQRLVQSVTDAGKDLSKAKFGAFFYNVVNNKGDAYTLYTLSGAARKSFEKYPMPRKTEIFAPTFDGTAVVRSDDIKQDPRYGRSAPHFGTPPGHLPVRSYLAVPVISRSGEVIGGLFYGHPEPGVFTEREENLVVGLASQAAIAVDNARLYKKAKEAIATRDEFLSIASHELKTPLTPLRLQLQGFLRHLQKGNVTELSPERASKIARVCDQQVMRLAHLVDNLLDISRINAGKLTLNKEEIDVCEVLSEIVERFRPQIQSAKAQVEIQGPPVLRGLFDRLRLEQVIVNLLSNALKHAPGSPIQISLSEIGGQLWFSVKDQGAGVSESDHAKIFDRFERGGSAKEGIGGLGLGLYITRQIVEAHGGTIRVESKLGSGAAFIVEVPLWHEASLKASTCVS